MVILRLRRSCEQVARHFVGVIVKCRFAAVAVGETMSPRDQRIRAGSRGEAFFLLVASYPSVGGRGLAGE
jgi:hypothetical protein